MTLYYTMGGPRPTPKSEKIFFLAAGMKTINKRQYYTSKKILTGQGIFVTCVRNKERSALSEVMMLLEQAVEDLYGTEEASSSLDLEDEIAKEIASLSRKSDKALQAVETKLDCVLFISVEDKYDPVRIVEHTIREALRTGETQTRFTQRLEPVSFGISSLSVDSVIERSRDVIAKAFGVAGSSVAAADKPSPVFESTLDSNMSIDHSRSSDATQNSDSGDKIINAPEANTIAEISNTSNITNTTQTTTTTDSKPLQTFSIQPTLRHHNDPWNRDSIIKQLGEIITGLNIPAKADLKNPDLVLLPIFFKHYYGFSVVNGALFTESKRFNLQSIGPQ